MHGGRGVAPAARVDDGLLESLEKLLPLDPPCLAQSLAAIRALQAAAPGLLHVACFDGAFYRTGASVSRALPLPREIEEAGLEDYGYHGLSYEYIAQVLPTFLGSAAEGRVVVAHLGNESSMCAMRQREHVANTADIRALESLPMGTRCGALDPGVILYLMSERGMSRQEITRLLYHQSGLLGVSGISGDMRELLQNTSPTAAQAIELFVYRIGRELGSLAAAIELAEEGATLTIPDPAGPYVFVIENGTVHRRPIVIDVASVADAAILRGLKEGDVVAIPGSVGLSDGMRVTITSRTP